MKLKIATIILFLVCVGLGIALLMKQKRTEEAQKTSDEQIVALSNEVTKTSSRLEEQRQVNIALDKEIKTRDSRILDLSNSLTQLNAKLEKTESDAKAREQAAQTELAKREAKISDLEGQKVDMTKRMTALTNQITDLQRQIADTERQLADTRNKLGVSEGDREFLLKELKRLQTAKADLERQFNDLVVLRDQVSKLKDELAIARRLEFIRAGVFSGMKGAEMLMKRAPATSSAGTNFNLNVEFKQQGGARVVPVVPATNAPAPPK